MQQFFVTNPKGGCGKTTLSVHISSHYARQGRRVVLVDHDAQQSSSDWLKMRSSKAAPIRGLVGSVDKAFDFGDAELVVHDMPAAWTLDHVSDLIKASDKVIVPVLPSPTDIKACLRFVMSLHRTGILESGVQVGFVANRLRSNAQYVNILNEFLVKLNLPVLAKLRDTQNYVKVMDKGVSIFDLSSAVLKKDKAAWASLFEWLDA
jgi:chromosome partitioning protein